MNFPNGETKLLGKRSELKKSTSLNVRTTKTFINRRPLSINYYVANRARKPISMIHCVSIFKRIFMEVQRIKYKEITRKIIK